MDTFIYFVFSFAVYIQICEGLYGCNQSMPTISYVESCPKNKTEWNIAARRKNCDSLAAFQTCTEPENFQYHCLENQRQTMTLEICAPIFYLQGYCARYSTDKKRVEENYDIGFECLKFDESERCPTRYPSTDAYKYQRCYKLKYQKPTQTSCSVCTSPSSQPETTPIVTKEYFGNDTNDSIKTAFLVILALVLAGVIVFFVLFYKRKSLNLQRFRKVLTCDVETGSNDEEEGNRANESSCLLLQEPCPDVQATDKAPNDSTSLEPISGNSLLQEDTQPSALISSDNIDVSHSSSIDVPSSTPLIGDDPELFNSDKDIVSKTKSKQEPVGDKFLKPIPYNEGASVQKSDTFLNSTSNLETDRFMKAKPDDQSLSKPKSVVFTLSQVKSDTKNTSKPSESENDPTEISIQANITTEDKSRDAYEEKFNKNPPKSNEGHGLKPVSNEKISSKSPSLEASDSRQVSNDKSGADQVTASHTSSNSVSKFESTREDAKKVDIDDSKGKPTALPTESPQSLLFDKPSLSKKNNSGSKAPDDSVSYYDQISLNGTDVPKQSLQKQATAKSTPKDVPASDIVLVSTLSAENPAPDNGTTSKPMPKNNPVDKDATPSALSSGNPAPDSAALKLKSGNNPYDRDTTSSATADNEPNPGNNPREKDTPPSESKKLKKPAPPIPSNVTKNNEPQNVPLQRKKERPPRPQEPPTKN